MGTKNKTEKEEYEIAKRLNKNLVFNVNSSNTDRPVNPTVDNNKSLSRNNSAEEMAENDVFPTVTTHSFHPHLFTCNSTMSSELNFFSCISL